MVDKILNQLSPLGKKIFYAAIILSVLAIIDRLFFGPVTHRIEVLKKEIQEQEQGVKRDLRVLSYKPKILKEIQTVRNFYSNEIESDEKIIANFLKEIERLATKSNVNVIKVSPSEDKQKKVYIEYQANLECSGQLEDVIRFIYSIDSSDSLLKVVHLNMIPKPTGPKEVNASMTIAKIIVESSS